MFDGTITPESLIDTKGLRTAAIVAALYNAASKVDHGKKNPDPDTITEAEAEAVLTAQGYQSFDYLYGKRLKIDLKDAKNDGIVAGQYDYGQGRGTAKTAIEILRRTGDPCHSEIIELQHGSKIASMRASTPLPPRYRFNQSGQGSFPFQDNLAEALELSQPPTDEELDELREKYGCHSTPYLHALSRQVVFNERKKAPCTTINL